MRPEFRKAIYAVLFLVSAALALLFMVAAIVALNADKNAQQSALWVIASGVFLIAATKFEQV